MNQPKFSFLSGISSVFEVWPSRDYREFVPKGSVSSRIGHHWSKAGSYLSASMVRYEAQDRRNRAASK